MRRGPRNLKIAFDDGGLTHFGGAYFFHEFLHVLQLRRFLGREVPYPRRNHRYSVSQMLLALVYPIVLGLDRIETSSFLRSNGTFQYLTGLPGFPDPQTLRRFLLNAPPRVWEHLHRANDRLLQNFIHLPDRRSRLILDLDSTVVTVFGRQDGAEVGYNPKYRGKRSYNPLLCLEANSSFLWDTELRPGNASVWESSPTLLQTSFVNVPPDIRELRFRGDAGFGYEPVLRELENQRAMYAVVARLTAPLKRRFPGLTYERANARWELAETEYRAQSGRTAAASLWHAASLKRRTPKQRCSLWGVTCIEHGPPTSTSRPPVFGASTRDEPRWSRASTNCVRTSPFATFPPLHSRPTRYIWRSSVSPTTLSPRSSEPAFLILGKATRSRACVSSYFCCPANSSALRTIPLFDSRGPHSSGAWQMKSSRKSPPFCPWMASKNEKNEHLHAGFKWLWPRRLIPAVPAKEIWLCQMLA